MTYRARFSELAIAQVSLTGSEPQVFRMTIVLGYDSRHVHRYYHPVSYDRTTPHYRVSGTGRRAEYRRGHRVRQAPGEVDTVEIERKKVGAFSYLERSDIAAAQDRGTAASC